MPILLLQPQDINGTNHPIVKFVKVGGEYRFFDHFYNHIEMVGEGEIPQSAGTLLVFDTFCRMEDCYSTTLKIGCSESDYEALAKILNRPIKGKWED